MNDAAERMDQAVAPFSYASLAFHAASIRHALEEPRGALSPQRSARSARSALGSEAR